MLWLYSLAYLVVALRYIMVIPNATVPMLQGWTSQWGLYVAGAAFFGLFWSVRSVYPNFFRGRGRIVVLLAILGTLGFITLLWPAVWTHPELIYHGFVTDLAPNLTTYYGLGLTILAFVDLVFYIGIGVVVVFFINLIRRRSLGFKIMFKNLIIWIGLLLIFITLLLDTGLRFIPGADLITISARGLMAAGFFLFWFGYRLADFIIR